MPELSEEEKSGPTGGRLVLSEAARPLVNCWIFPVR